MRALVTGAAVALFACSGSSQRVAAAPEIGSPAADAGPTPSAADAGASDLAVSLVFSGDGTGSVQSTDGAIACSSSCMVRMKIGATLELVPAAATGSHFEGWSGACAGNGRCTVTPTANASVTARFVKDAAYHPTGYLTVKRSGKGKITSEPKRIECGFDCFGDFTNYGPVTLTATPAAGFRFAGWGGACTGTDRCVVNMAAAPVTVTAVFDHVLPLPDGCHAMLPASIPRPVIFDPAAGLPVDATSDVSGENFLFTVNSGGAADSSRDYHFVRIQAGTATELAVRSFPYPNGCTTCSAAVSGESQPRGFDVFHSSADGLVFDVYAPDGTLVRTVSTLQPLKAGETSQNVEYSVVPSGGVAIVRYVWRATSGYTLHYGRFDEQGLPVVADVPFEMAGSYLIDWGVGTSGNVLLVGAQGHPFSTGPTYGRWLESNGAPLTDWFSAGDEYIQNFFLLRTPWAWC